MHVRQHCYRAKSLYDVESRVVHLVPYDATYPPGFEEELGGMKRN
jgi:hypothetical protein